MKAPRDFPVRQHQPQRLWRLEFEPGELPSAKLFQHVLPGLDQGNLYGQINFNASALDPGNVVPASFVIPVYRCPSYSGPSYSTSPLYGRISTTYALRNYAAMGATSVGGLYGLIVPADGVFYAGSSATRIADVTDGTTNTIFIVETRDPVGSRVD